LKHKFHNVNLLCPKDSGVLIIDIVFLTFWHYKIHWLLFSFQFKHVSMDEMELQGYL